MKLLKSVNEDNSNIIKKYIHLPELIDEVFSYMVEPSSEVTPYLINASLQKYTITSINLKGDDYTNFVMELIRFLHFSRSKLWIYELGPLLSDVFEEYAYEYLDSEKLPQGKNCTVEIITALCYYISGIPKEDADSVFTDAKKLKPFLSKFIEQKEYDSLLDEYNDLKNVDNYIIKSVKSIDVSNLPPYILEDMYFYEGKYYRPSDIRKMITASSQTAQALENQDLEDDTTGLTLEEIGKRYLSRLKDKKYESNSKMEET